jgi:hypothetical protein
VNNWGKYNKARREKYAANPEAGREQLRIYVANHPEKAMLYRARQRAKILGIECSLTENDIKIPEFCPVLGIRLERKGSKDRDAAPSLDRINSNLGYTSNNVRVISNKANQIKSNATASELAAVLNYVLSFQKEE